MENYNIGQKVKYVGEDGEQHLGKIHAVQQHETAEGLITGTTYLVDTGKDVRVDEVNHYHPKTHKLVRTDKLRQPEQLALPAEMIEAA